MFPIYHIIILVKEKGWVEPNESQRRAGIFTEKTGCISVKGYGKLSPMKGGGNYTDETMVNGSCEHLKEFLPRDKKVAMEANTLYWITDQTPQEWLP